MRVEWKLSYQSGSPHPWAITGYTDSGNVFAEYVFTVKPTKRQIRRTIKGKCDAVICVYF